MFSVSLSLYAIYYVMKATLVLSCPKVGFIWIPQDATVTRAGVAVQRVKHIGMSGFSAKNFKIYLGIERLPIRIVFTATN
jgi:hypothetical protein